MATTKKGTAGKQAGAGAGTNATKAKGAAKATKTQPAARSKAAPASKSAPVAIKLNDRQRGFLTRIKEAGDAGFFVGPMTEQRTIDALIERKLVKKGARNKETSKLPYFLTKAGEKHLPASRPAPAPTPPPPPAPEPAMTIEPPTAPPA